MSTALDARVPGSNLFRGIFFLHIFELLQICETQKSQPEYVLENILRKHGHDCLRLPVYHTDLNAIELVWAQVKGYVARQNSSFKSACMMQLIENGLQSVTSDQWKSCCEHVCYVEEKY